MQHHSLGHLSWYRRVKINSCPTALQGLLCDSSTFKPDWALIRLQVVCITFLIYTHPSLSCNGSHRRRPTPLPSWSQSLGTACSSKSRREGAYHLTNFWAQQQHETPFGNDITSTCNNVSAPHKTVAHLCCHDEARGGGVDGDVTGHQSHVLKLFVHLSVLLVGEGLDGAGEDHSLLLSEC